MSKKATAKPQPKKGGRLRAVAAKIGLAPVEKVVDPTEAPALDSTSNEDVAIQPPQSPATPAGEQKMTLTLKGLDKRGRSAIYTGAAIAIRIGVSAFPNKTAAQTIEVADGALAGPKQKAERVARVKLTKEERAALPKPTLAERVARAEARTAALKAKLASAEQPAL